MPAVTLDPAEVLAFNPDLDAAQVTILVRDGMALARIVAPCIDDEDFAYADAAAAIIRAAVLRWAESGSGALSAETSTAGPFGQTLSYDTRQARRSLFFPSEITSLEKLCRSNRSQVGAIDTIGSADVSCRLGQCPYMLGSVSVPCPECGLTRNHYYGDW